MSRRPTFEQYLHGERGARTVVVPQQFVTWLARTGVLKVAREQRTRDPLVDAVLTALALAATESVPRSEPRLVPRAEPVASSGLTTQQASEQLGITVRAVVKRCQDKRLDAEQDPDGRWHIDADSVAAAATRRTA